MWYDSNEKYDPLETKDNYVNKYRSLYGLQLRKEANTKNKFKKKAGMAYGKQPKRGTDDCFIPKCFIPQ